MPELETGELSIAKLKQMGAPWNPRKMSDDEMASLRRSMKFFGVVEPIVVNLRTERIVGGHMRVRAAEAEGIETLPCVYVDLDEPSEKQLNLALNRISGNWDHALLRDLIAGLAANGADMELTGFGNNELKSLLEQQAAKDGKTDPDAVPDLADEAITETGDLIVLGNHRLVCGDGTDAETVAKVLGGASVDLCLTDPPYSVQLDQRRRADNSRLGGVTLSKKAMQNYKGYKDIPADEAMRFFDCLPCDRVAMTYQSRNQNLVALGAAMERNKFQVAWELMWLKNHAVKTYGATYLSRHEMILVMLRTGTKLDANVPTTETTVFEVDRAHAHEFHPAQRPIELWDKLLAYHCREAVFDPFVGSGTTIISAERLGRRAYAIECQPHYCDVVVKRWEEFTGKKAERVPRGTVAK